MHLVLVDFVFVVVVCVDKAVVVEAVV